jgi:hypothetical protein
MQLLTLPTRYVKPLKKKTDPNENQDIQMSADGTNDKPADSGTERSVNTLATDT